MNWPIGILLLVIILFLVLRLRHVEEEKRMQLAAAQREVQRARERTERLTAELDWSRQLFQLMPFPALVISRELEMLYANPAAEALFGEVTPGEAAIVRLRHSSLLKEAEKALQDGRREPRTVELQDKQYMIYATGWAGATASQPDGAVLLMQDVTQLMQLSRARREMASNLSHELRTPLTSVRLMCETLLDGMPEERAFNRKFVRRIGAETEAMIRLVEDLTALSRIESGRTALRMEPTNLCQLLDARVQRLSSQISLKHLNVQIEGCDSAIVSLDPERFGQVLTNVLDNAIKHSPEGGTIFITIDWSETDCILTIRDEGGGIAPADLSRIFERFYKGDRARQRAQVAGTGLGLAITKHLVEAHGGTIRASNHPQRGAVFTITLPAPEVAELPSR